MQPNFEKQISDEPQNLESEETLEQFDKEILKEADKLSVNLEELKTDIDDFGGPEKFKEWWESKRWSDSGPSEASYLIETINKEKKEKTGEVKRLAMVSTLLTVVTAITAFLVFKGNPEPTATEKFMESYHMSDSDGGSAMAQTTALLEAIGILGMIVTATAAIGDAVNSIKLGIETRKINRKKKIAELKFKMTGTEVK